MLKAARRSLRRSDRHVSIVGSARMLSSCNVHNREFKNNRSRITGPIIELSFCHQVLWDGTLRWYLVFSELQIIRSTFSDSAASLVRRGLECPCRYFHFMTSRMKEG